MTSDLTMFDVARLAGLCLLVAIFSWQIGSTLPAVLVFGWVLAVLVLP
jgi:hypothetical protein